MTNKTSSNSSAGYSGTPLSRRLGVKPGHRVALRSAPRDFESRLDALPDNVKVCRSFRGKTPFDVIVLFCRMRADLVRNFPSCRTRLAQNGGLWIAWPKKASTVQSDLGEARVREFGLAAGLVDNKVCAIDETWSGLRFVVRFRDRT